MKLGNTIIRVGLGILFIWGGVEKFFTGLFGGVGLDKMAATLGSIGFGFLGDTGTYILAIFLAATELVAGVFMILNKRTAISFIYAAFIMLIAIITVYLPTGNWMQSMIHVALLSTFLGLGIEAFQKRKLS